MSMINDALRRASSAAKTNPGSLSPESSGPILSATQPSNLSDPVPPLLPAPPIFRAGLETEPIPAPPVMRIEPTLKKSRSPIVIAAVMLCIFGAVAAFFWQKRQVTVAAREKGKEAGLEQASARPGNEAAVTRMVTEGGEVAASQPRPTSTTPAETPAAKTNSAASTTAAPIVAAVQAAPPVPVKFPPLRLQSIFYRPANPSVIINGKTLFITDEINGVTVADIRPANVTLVLSGQTNVLTLR